MTVSIESDSDRNTYEVWKQEQASSCGVASIWMARGLVKQQCIDEDEWPLAQRVFSGAVRGAMNAAGGDRFPVCYNPGAFPKNQSSMGSTFSQFGLFSSQVATGLQNEGLHANFIGAQSINPVNLGPGKAVIAFVRWRPAGNGAHFVCAARMANNGAVVFLDPWDGKVNEQWNNGTYAARYGGVGDILQVINVWR
ncbi:hypothetical protein [Sphingomonas sp.]|uniref:hypothetical protein n=1 Tax=Sphingomonas sp. TaxID=28214 RepID=UPI003CC514B6